MTIVSVLVVVRDGNADVFCRYVSAEKDRVTVVFSTIFKDDDDIVIGKVFLQVSGLVVCVNVVSRCMSTCLLSVCSIFHVLQLTVYNTIGIPRRS